MKRSEMSRIIYTASCEKVPYHDDGGIQLSWRVENILKAIEKAGMLPPEIPVLQTAERIIHANKWESENEET